MRDLLRADAIIPFGAEAQFYRVTAKETKVECINSAQKSSLAYSWGYAMNAVRGKLDW